MLVSGGVPFLREPRRAMIPSPRRTERAWRPALGRGPYRSSPTALVHSTRTQEPGAPSLTQRSVAARSLVAAIRARERYGKVLPHEANDCPISTCARGLRSIPPLFLCLGEGTHAAKGSAHAVDNPRA
jgi:hypothetical protein